MKIVSSIPAMSAISATVKKKRLSIGFVPTMGALHAGHVSLMQKAKKENDITVVSIFVNPIQFSPNEDFARYPRNQARDSRICRKEGIDFIFCPSADAMFPSDYKTFVHVQDLSALLCGKSRPGHFQGVATVVAKLFTIIRPDAAYFGQKDIQQSVIIKKMVRDLHMGINIKVLPTVREKDGVAVSSRNVYLSPEQRREAAVLYQGLMLAKKLLGAQEKNSKKIEARVRSYIKRHSNAKIEYVALVDETELKPLKRIQGRCIIAVAAKIGTTRLIDNIMYA